MRCHYFKHIFPAAETKSQTPCCAWAGDGGTLPLGFSGASNTVSTPRCADPPRRLASHVLALAPPGLSHHSVHGQPPTPQPEPSGFPEAASDPTLRCGVAPGLPPALLRKQEHRGSPEEPVALASRHLDPALGSFRIRGPASPASPAAARPSPRLGDPRTAALSGAAAGQMPGQGKPKGGLGLERGR